MNWRRVHRYSFLTYWIHAEPKAHHAYLHVLGVQNTTFLKITVVYFAKGQFCGRQSLRRSRVNIDSCCIIYNLQYNGVYTFHRRQKDSFFECNMCTHVYTCMILSVAQWLWSKTIDPQVPAIPEILCHYIFKKYMQDFHGFWWIFCIQNGILQWLYR